MNEKIAHWFQDGNFYEALSGDGLFFVQDHTYRSHHDLILVLFTMLEWASSVDVVDTCAENFVSALVRIIDENPIKALMIINGYLITSEESKVKLPIDLEHLYLTLTKKIQTIESYSQAEKKQIQSIMSSIGKKLSGLKEKR